MLLIVLAFSLSVDAIGVGLSFGLRDVKISGLAKIVVGLFSMVYAGLAVFAGGLLSELISPQSANLIGCMILFVIGAWIVLSKLMEWGEAGEHEESMEMFGCDFDKDHSGVIDKKEAFMLVFVLSLDSVGVGVGLGATGISSYLFPVFIGLLQVAFLCIGEYAGKKVADTGIIGEKAAPLIAGAMLIGISIARL